MMEDARAAPWLGGWSIPSWGWLVTATGCKARRKDFGGGELAPQQKEARGESPQHALGTPVGLGDPRGRQRGEGWRKGEGKGSAGPAGRASFLLAQGASRGLRREKAPRFARLVCWEAGCRAGLQRCQTSPTKIGIICKGNEIPFLPSPDGDFLAFQRAVFHHKEVAMSLSFPVQL